MAGGVISTDGSRIDHHDLFSKTLVFETLVFLKHLFSKTYFQNLQARDRDPTHLTKFSNLFRRTPRTGGFTPIGYNQSISCMESCQMERGDSHGCRLNRAIRVRGNWSEMGVFPRGATCPD